ncbi:MAG: APC family permease, partial [Clostridia bacterium]|nr:APC family permease [Clostridia bacterium]
PQAAEEFKFSYKKVIGIMVVAILFGCFVYTTNNTVAAAALANWPDRVMAGEWVLLVAAEEMLGVFGKVLIGTAVSCAVLSGIMGFYLASSRLMYSMANDGYLPKIFGKIDGKHGTPKNAIIFCLIISLSGPILGREALGWFVDMSAIGASMGFFLRVPPHLKRCAPIKMEADS